MTQFKSLVLVLGAGASEEVGLPIGSKLTERIASTLTYEAREGEYFAQGDPHIDACFRALAQTPAAAANPNHFFKKLIGTGRQIVSGMPQAASIDNYIHNHRGDPLIALVGKLGIVKCIIESEKESDLYIDLRNSYNGLDFGKLTGSWFHLFFQRLVEYCDVEELPERMKQVAVVSFNYDRCFEHFLYHALQNYFKMEPEHAASLVNDMDIFHPYGTVGRLEWQGENHAPSYGQQPDTSRLLATASQLKTFTEATEPGAGLITAQRWIQHAKRIAFLGFAYHPLNLNALFNTQLDINPGKLIFGTALGMSEMDRDTVRRRIAGKVSTESKNVFLQDLRCFELLHQNQLGLSLTQ